MNLIRKYIVFVVILLMPFPANSQSVDSQKSGEKWVCTWATAQQLDEVAFPKINLPPNIKLPQQNTPPPNPVNAEAIRPYFICLQTLKTVQ